MAEKADQWKTWLGAGAIGALVVLSLYFATDASRMESRLNREILALEASREQLQSHLNAQISASGELERLQGDIGQLTSESETLQQEREANLSEFF